MLNDVIANTVAAAYARTPPTAAPRNSATPPKAIVHDAVTVAGRFVRWAKRNNSGDASSPPLTPAAMIAFAVDPAPRPFNAINRNRLDAHASM